MAVVCTIISTHASKWHLFILDMNATVCTIQLLAVLGRHRRAKSMDLRAVLYCPCRPCFERSCSCPGSCFVGSCPAHGATLWPCLSNGATAIQSATLWSCTRRYGHSKVCFENKKNDSCSHADLIPDSCYKFNLFYSISKTKSNKI
jgi:hypothetical protein